jgi:enterochelin esterase-like enzyme
MNKSTRNKTLALKKLLPYFRLISFFILLSQATAIKILGQHQSITYFGTPFESRITELKSLPEKERGPYIGQLIRDYPNSPVIEHDTIVSLFWYGKADQVLIHGDLQSGWSKPDTMERISCGENAFFTITYSIPVDARLDYQFQVDSEYMTDPRNHSITPSGYGPHSEIAMPGFKPDHDRVFREDIPHGTLDSIELTSKDRSIRPREAMIYLPSGYDTLALLPVLCVMDGLEALEYMSYVNVLDVMIAEEKITPVIAVFIPLAERGDEFSGNKSTAFMEALCDEFIPFIDNIYKTNPRPPKRGIAGISNGGFFALLTMLKRPDVFLCAAGQSPIINHVIYEALQDFKRNIKPSSELKIYCDVGRFDLPGSPGSGPAFFQAAIEFHQTLEMEGINHFMQVVNDGHEWANWRERTDNILIYFFGKNN